MVLCFYSIENFTTHNVPDLTRQNKKASVSRDNGEITVSRRRSWNGIGITKFYAHFKKSLRFTFSQHHSVARSASRSISFSSAVAAPIQACSDTSKTTSSGPLNFVS